jgi:hypothetical protein
MSLQLKKQLAEGDNVVRRLSKIALAARPSPETSSVPASPALSPAKAVAAAAQAFSDRRRSDGLAA